MDRIIFHIDVNSAYLSWSAIDMIVERDDPAIHFCANHAVADCGMDGIGEVNYRCVSFLYVLPNAAEWNQKEHR